jgi:hypothetical protein
MITCGFNGRLGNNLYQIATAIALADKVGADFILPETTWAGHRGNIPVNLSMFEYDFKRGTCEVDTEYDEKTFEYQDIPASDRLKIGGFFQSYKYFDHISNLIRNKYFTPSSRVLENLKKYDVSPDSLGISVRRGDYLMLQHNHCVLSTDYYQDVINTYFQNNIDSIYVFSDDIEWCQSVFGDGVKYIQDDIGTQLFLMSRMKHLILSNSTFAWWGAYLNTQGGTTVLPDPWFGPANADKDTSGLYYPGWVRHNHSIVEHPYTITENMFN